MIQNETLDGFDDLARTRSFWKEKESFAKLEGFWSLDSTRAAVEVLLPVFNTLQYSFFFRYFLGGRGINS